MFPVSDILLGVETLARHLAANGWSVRVVPTEPRRGLLDLVDTPPSVIAVDRNPVCEVRLRIGGSLWGFGAGSSSRTSLGGIPISASQSMPMQLHWLVRVDPTGRPEDFDAKLDTERGGFLWTGEVRAARWQGGALADALNADPPAVLATAKPLRLSERLFVKPAADERCVRIIHQSKVTARMSMFAADVFSAERHLPERALLEGVTRIANAVVALGSATPRPRTPRSGKHGPRPRRFK